MRAGTTAGTPLARHQAAAKYGSGFIRIRKELEGYPEVNFSVEESGGGVLVTFRVAEGVNGGVSGGVNVISANTLGQGRIRFQPPWAFLRGFFERLFKMLKDEQNIVYKGAPKTGGYFIQQGED